MQGGNQKEGLMVSQEEVERQLNRIGCNFRLWGRTELAELKNIIMESETIAHCVNGHYEGGFGLLCATDHRVLLVDRKPMGYLNVGDIRFETISEFDYHNNIFNASVHICTPTKTITFVSWNQHRLRTLLTYVQQRVIEIRQYYYMAHQFQAMAAQQFQQQAQPVATYIPNTAPLQQSNLISQTISDTASTLGAHTYTKLPHFRRHQHRRIGSYALPDAIFNSAGQQVGSGA
jgi:Bacterial PH domain